MSTTQNSTTAASSEVVAKAPATAGSEAPFYTLPDTLRNWPYERIISPYYRSAQAESVAWLESFKPFSPAAQVAFNKCDFSKNLHLVSKSNCQVLIASRSRFGIDLPQGHSL